MITRIEIEGYKSIKSLKLELQPINILLGSNGVGKSNFISIFSLIRHIFNENLQNYVLQKGGADSLLHFGKKHTQTIRIKIQFINTNEQNIFTVDLNTRQNGLFIKEIKSSFKENDKWLPQLLEENVLESKYAEMILISDFPDEQASFFKKQQLKFTVYHFHDTSDASPMKKSADVHDNERLKGDGSNLAAFLYYLKEKEPKHFKRIELTIQSIAPFFDRFDLKPTRLNEQKIQLEWKEKGFPDNYFNAYHLSDGTLRFICLATLLMQPNPPKTIVIDEPELGLHPVAINKLAALIRKASTKAQIILSTQSINLIDNFEPEDIIVTDRENHESVFRRLKSEDLKAWLEEFTLGDLWGKNKFGAQPYSI